MNEEVIKVKSVTKVYRLYDSPVDRLKEALHPFGKKFHREFFAVRNLCMDIPKGQCVGIIGMNGSGKSTILQIIAGVLTATSGSAEVRGRVAALLELGGGFNPEFTGIENIHFQCSIMGIPSHERDEFIQNILDFAEIGDFAYQPVRTYSSGMYVRLAFAVAVHLEPEILIVDEVLAVGDADFQRRCLGKMREVSRSGRTVLFVSHNLQSVRSLCSNSLVLSDGKLRFLGETHDAINHYLTSNSTLEGEGEVTFGGDAERYGSGEVLLRSIRVRNSRGNITANLLYKEPFTIELSCEVKKNINQCTLFLSLTDTQDTFSGLAYSCDAYPAVQTKPGSLTFRFKVESHPLPGEYYLLPCISNLQQAIDQIQRAIRINVSHAALNGKKSFPLSEVRGNLLLAGEWEVSQSSAKDGK